MPTSTTRWIGALAGLLAASGLCAQTPAIASGGIVNAASLLAYPAAPGSLISIYGDNLAAGTLAFSLDVDGKVPTLLGGTQVAIGGRLMPLLFVSPGQINAQVPFELQPATYEVRVTTAAGTSAPATLPVRITAPAIFAGAVVRYPDYSLVNAAAPARGKDTLIAFATGLGQVNGPAETGSPATSAPAPSNAAYPVEIAGRTVAPLGSALSPGFVGLYQVAFHMLPGFPPGRFPLRFYMFPDSTPSPYYALDTGSAVRIPPSASPFPGRKTLTTYRNTNLAIGDFNLDGNADVVLVGDQRNGGIEVLMGNGDGTFAPSKLYDVPSVSGILYVGDFNNDRKPDILIGGAWILLGNGDGTFQAERATGIAGVASPGHMAIGDFNGDGRLDFATHSSTGLIVSLGRGDGTFAPSGNITLASRPDGLFAGRFNPHPFDDLLAFTEGGAVSIVLSNGDGTFQAPKIQFGLPSGFDVTAVGDFNRDGATDVAVSGSFYSPDYFVRMGNGDGTFQSPVKTELPEYAIAVRDLNSDQVPDIVGVDAGNHVFVSIGVGDGTFQAGPLYDLGNYSGDTAYIGLGDVNRDGFPDVISIPTFRDGVVVHLGYGDGSFEALRYPNGAGNSTEGWGRALAADLDKDGKVDLIAIGLNSAAVLWNDNGAFVQTPMWFGSSSSLPLATGDFNGDGWPDVANGGAIYLGGPGRTFRALKPVDLGLNPSAVATGDFNRDGRSDLVALDRFGQLIKVCLARADGSLDAPISMTSSGFPTAVVTGDVNGDGITDLVTDLEVLLGKGDGTFQVSQRFTPSRTAFNPLVLGDFNRDGTVDIAMGNGFDLWIYRGNRNGTFQTPTRTTYAGNITALAAADVDRDGATDILLSVATRDVVYLRNRGDGTFNPEVRFIGGGVQINSLNVFDADGDGRPDIVAGTAILDRKR